MTASAQDINLMLREIEQELQSIDLGTDKPSTAYGSSFPAWVQRVMIPTFDRVLLRYGELPESCRMTRRCPARLSPLEQTEQLLALIEELDGLLC